MKVERVSKITGDNAFFFYMSLCCRGVSNLELKVTGKVEYDFGSGKYVSFVL